MAEKEHMERFLLPSLESVMDSNIKDSEGRIRNVEFKMGVQIAILTELLAEHLDYSDEDLDRLRADAIRHLKETNGSFRLLPPCSDERKEKARACAEALNQSRKEI